MNNREVKKKCNKVMREYGMVIVPYTLKYFNKMQTVIFKCVSQEYGTVFQIVVNFEACQATKQMLGAVAIHPVRNIDWMFFD